MKRSGSWLVVGLALLVAAAFLLHRPVREDSPPRSREHPPAVEAAAPSESPGPAAPAPARRTTAAVAPDAVPPRIPGTVRGLVKITGGFRKRKVARTDADPACAALHGGSPLLSDTLVTDANGNLQWAFVYVKSGPIGTPPPAPASPVTIDQVNCVFIPHMVGIRVGQPLRVVNSDRLLHVVHVIPITNKESNVGLPQAQMDHVRTFDAPEVMVKIKCDIHPWMAAWVGVMDHPHFSITNELGSFLIPNLPPGKYVVEAWHEQCDPVALSAEVAPGGDFRLDFALDYKSR
jgi:plastocyanin